MTLGGAKASPCTPEMFLSACPVQPIVAIVDIKQFANSLMAEVMRKSLITERLS